MPTQSTRNTIYKRFVKDTSGAVLILFAAAIFVILGAAGVAIDHSRALHLRTKLAQAADAAALAAAKHAKDLVEDGASVAEAKKNGEKVGETVWKANAILTDGTATLPKITLSNDASGWTAQIDYTGQVDTAIAAIIGFNKVDVGGSTEVKTGAGKIPYLDFYLLLDTSQSMGLAATQAGITQLISLTGCQFGCHVTGQSENYDAAHVNNIPMRIDVLREATIKLIEEAENTATVSDQFRIGLWTFDNNQQELTAPTDNYNTLNQDAGQIDLPTYEDGTQIDDAIAYLTGQVTNSGTGSTVQTPKKYVFLVTDGVQDGLYTGWTPPPGLPAVIAGPGMAKTQGGISPISPTACDALKAMDITVAVLHTTYVPFTSWEYPYYIDPINDDITANVKSCASPGYYFEATSGPEIEPALQQIFTKVVTTASNLRVTK